MHRLLIQFWTWVLSIPVLVPKSGPEEVFLASGENLKIKQDCKLGWKIILLQNVQMTFKMIFRRAVIKGRDLGWLPFTWKTQIFQLENQMLCIILFGVLLKLWASGKSDAFLLHCTPFGIYTWCSYILHAVHLLLRQAKSFRIYAENFHPGGLRKW